MQARDDFFCVPRLPMHRARFSLAQVAFERAFGPKLGAGELSLVRPGLGASQGGGHGGGGGVGGVGVGAALGAAALRGAQWQRLYLRRAMILHAHVGALDDDGGGSGSGSSSSDSPGSGASDGGGGGGRARGRGVGGRLGHDYEVCACEQRGGVSFGGAGVSFPEAALAAPRPARLAPFRPAGSNGATGRYLAPFSPTS